MRLESRCAKQPVDTAPNTERCMQCREEKEEEEEEEEEEVVVVEEEEEVEGGGGGDGLWIEV